MNVNTIDEFSKLDRDDISYIDTISHDDSQIQQQSTTSFNKVTEKEVVSFEGYIFVKLLTKQPGQAETWARAKRTSMLLPQSELYALVKKRKNKDPSNKDMIGFKRRQIDQLLEHRTRTDNDSRFEYKLASLRLRQKTNFEGRRETTSMQVILKRALRSRVATMTFDNAASLGEIVDLEAAHSDENIIMTATRI